MGTRRRCLAPDAQSAVGASLRSHATLGRRGLGPRDQEKRPRRMPLRGYVLASWTVAAEQQSVSVLVSEAQYSIKYKNRLGALDTSLRRHTEGSQRWHGRSGPTPCAARSALFFAAPNPSS